MMTANGMLFAAVVVYHNLFLSFKLDEVIVRYFVVEYFAIEVAIVAAVATVPYSFLLVLYFCGLPIVALLAVADAETVVS